MRDHIDVVADGQRKDVTPAAGGGDHLGGGGDRRRGGFGHPTLFAEMGFGEGVHVIGGPFQRGQRHLRSRRRTFLHKGMEIDDILVGAAAGGSIRQGEVARVRSVGGGGFGVVDGEFGGDEGGAYFGC